MTSAAVLVLVPALVVLVTAVVALALRRRVQGRLFPDAGVQEWAETASGMSWRDRWSVERANTRGRAAPPHLAAAAAQRGRRTIAMVDRILTRGTSVRRFWLAGAALWAVLLVLAVALVVDEPGRWSRWLQVALAVYWLGVIWYLIGPPQRRLRQRLLRSVRLNEQLVADGDPDVSRR